MRYPLVFVLLLIQTAVFAQLPSGTFVAGFHFGTTGNMHLPDVFKNSNISGIPSTIIPPEFGEETYTITEKHKLGFSGSLFGYYRLVGFPYLSFQGDINIAQHWGGYHYKDIKDLEYDIDFKYWFANLLLSAKIHPGAKTDENDENWLAGFFARGGFYTGLNLTPNSIHYCHKPIELYGPCEIVQREIRDVINGKGDLGFMGGLGYEMTFGDTSTGLILEARYLHGLADVINVAPNGYGFSAQPNNTIRSLQFSIGFGFGF